MWSPTASGRRWRAIPCTRSTASSRSPIPAPRPPSWAPAPAAASLWRSARRAGAFWRGVNGESSGNVLLRRAQYRAADAPAPCCLLAARHGVRQGLQRPLEPRAYPARPRPARGRRGAGGCLRPPEGPAARRSRRRIPSTACADWRARRRPSTSAPFRSRFSATGRCFPFRRAAADRRWHPVNAMLSFAYSLLAHALRFRAGERGAGTPTWAFSTATAPDGRRWHWT